MKNFVLKVVNGKLEEWQRIALLLTMGFFTGIFVATYDVGASALFLDYHKADEEIALAQAFIVSGVLGILLTIIISQLQKRIGYEKVVVGVLSVVVLLVGAMAVWLRLDNTGGTVLFCAFVLIGPSNAVVILFFWGIFGRIFNFTGAKRLAGGIDSGQAIATILAFFAIPFVQPLLSNVSDFLLISAVSLFGAFVSAFLMTIRFEFLDRKAKLTASSKQEKPKPRKDYVLLMSAFVICSALSAYFVDFTFLNVASEKFQNKEDLANYLSFFGGTIIVFAFLIQTFINDLILEQYGLKIALLILPVLLFLFTLTATFAGNLFGFTVDEAGDNFLIFFVIVSMSKLFVDGLRDSLENPTVKIFFFPLDVRIRFDIQTRIEGIVSQFAGLLAGLIIMGLGALKFTDLLFNNYVLFGIIAVWVYVTFRMHKSYTEALTETLASSKTSNTYHENDPVLAEFLAHELEEREGTAYKYTLDIAERISPLLMTASLENYKYFFSDDKRSVALKKIAEQKIYSALPILKQALSSRTLQGNDSHELLEYTYETLRESKRKSKRLSVLKELAVSESPEDRIEACGLIAENFSEETFRFLTPLVRDVHPDVRRKAIIVVGQLQVEDFLPVLIGYMGEVGFENAATDSVRSFREKAMPSLETAFYKNGQKQNIQINIVQVYASIGGERAISLLLKKVDYPNKTVVKEVLIGLNHCNWTATGSFRAVIRGFLDITLRDTLWCKASIEEVNEIDGNEYLIQALKEQIKQDHNDIFLLLSILYDKDSVELVKSNMDMNTEDSVGYAMELLDIFVEDDIKVKLMPVLDDSPVEQKLKKLDTEFPRQKYDNYQVLEAIINRDYNAVNRWVKACAIHSLVHHQNARVSQGLIAQLFNPDPLIQETVAWAIYKMAPETYESCCKRLPAHQVKMQNRIIKPALKNESLLSLEKVTFLYQVPLLKGVSGMILSEIIEHMEEVRLPIGTSINMFDEFNHERLLLVADGQLAFKNQEGELSTFKGKYEIISEALMLHSELSNHEPVAVEDSRLYIIPSERFYEIMGDYYDLTKQVLHNIYQQIEQENETDDTIFEVYSSMN